MHALALTAIGKDRPGIVAGVTGALFELGCNLSDCSMTLLSGQFAMIMVLECPDLVDRSGLERALDAPAAEFGLTLTLQEVSSAGPPEGGNPYVVSVYGADRPGIVYRVASALASREVNVTNLESRAGSGVYTVILEVNVPEGGDERLGRDLTALAGELDVDLAMRPADTEAL